MKSLYMLLLSLFFMITSSCAVDEETVSGKYKASQEVGAAGADATSGGGEVGAASAGEEGEEGEEGLSPEEIAEMEALALREQGKEVYDGMCMGCHTAPATTTLDARDAATLVGAAGIVPHQGLAAFPDADVAEAIIAYLVEPI